MSISRSHRHKFAIVCPELEHRRWNTAELLDLACAALARLFLEGGLVPFSIGKGGYIYFFFLGLYTCYQPIAGEMASVMRKKRHFPGRAVANLLAGASCLPG